MQASLRLGFCLCVMALTAAVSALLQGAGPGGRLSAAGEPVIIELYGGGGHHLLQFDEVCRSEMTPGETCIDVLRVRHAGGESGNAFGYRITAWTVSEFADAGLLGPDGDDIAECFNVRLQRLPASGASGDSPVDGPKAGSDLDPFEEEAWQLSVSVDDNNACQGQNAYVMAMVEATELPETSLPRPPAAPIDLASEDSSSQDALDLDAEDSSSLSLPNTGLGPGPKPRTGLWITATASLIAGAVFLGASARLGKKPQP